MMFLHARLLACLAAVMTALPPVCCCIATDHAAAAVSVGAAVANHAGCCQRQASPADVESSPRTDGEDAPCECIIEAAAPFDLPMLVDFSPALLSSGSTFGSLSDVSDAGPVAPPAVPFPRPSLQILHCVWLC